MFDDSPPPPKIFANRVLRQMIDHMFGPDLEAKHEDYMALRVAFRSGGGLWDEVGHGNVVHITLLGKLVGAWGKMPGRPKTTDQVI